MIAVQQTLTRAEHAARWLYDFVTVAGGRAGVRDIFTAAERAGTNTRTLYRAREAAGVVRVPGSRRWRLDDGLARCAHCGGILEGAG